MRILLIAPPSRRILMNISGVYAMPPLGLAYIAAVLKKNGFCVDILDMPALGLKVEDLPSYIRRGDYSVCGISCNIFNLQNGLRVSRVIKQQNPDVLMVLGGRCTAFPSELIFRCNAGIDIIIGGEGEGTMLDLCRRTASSSPFYDMANISYRKNAEVIENENDADKLNLDLLPFPAREFLPNDRYRIHPPFNIQSPITLLETSRGCPYKCIFCSLSEKLRVRSSESVLGEIEQTMKDFAIKEIYFTDPNFTYNKERVIKLCDKILKKGIKITWTCKTRIDLVDEDVLKMMRRAGCYMISYGVESGSQKILDSLNKDITLDDIYRAFSLTAKEKIRTLAYILVGSPGENELTVRQTRQLLRKIKPDFVLFGELLPDPASALVQKAVLDGKVTMKELFDFYVFNKDIFNQANLYRISSGKVKYWLNVFNISFYFRFCYFLDRIKDLRNFRDFINMVQGVYFMIKDKYGAEKNRQTGNNLSKTSNGEKK